MQKIVLYSLVLIFISLYSCGEDKPPVDPSTKADIRGSVKLYDEGLNTMPNDSMIVTLFGSNPLITDTTDTQGRFVFNEVLYGSYSISFQKIGYGFHMINNVVHQNGTTSINKIIELGQFSTTQVVSINAKDTSGSILIRVSTNPAATKSLPKHIRIFFYHSDMVSFENFSNDIFLQNKETNPIEYRLNPHALEDMGFNSGETVWIKAYGDSYYPNDYIEPVKGKAIFPNLNLLSAAATSFIVP